MAKFKEIIVKSIDVQSGTYLNIDNETKGFTALDIYLVPKEGGEHERYVVDNNGSISKQSAGTSGEFVPMTGNSFQKPITGSLIIKNQDGSGNKGFAFIGDGVNTPGCQIQYDANEGDNEFTQSNIAISPQSSSLGTTKGYLTRSFESIFYSAYCGTNRDMQTKPEVRMFAEKYDNQGNSISITGIQVRHDKVILKGAIDADGDPTFTKQVVIKDDGTFGVKPASAGAGTPTLYPKVDIIDYTQDSTNYYLRVTVSNMTELGFAGNPYFKVSVGQASNEIEAVGMIASYGYSYVNTSSPIYIGGFHFTITIPKASNGHSWFWDDNIMMAVTWLGNDNLDIQGGVESPYKPRRIANDTKKIGDIKVLPELTVINYQKYAYFSGAGYNNPQNIRGIINTFIGGTINGKEMYEVTGQENLYVGYTDNLDLTTGKNNIAIGYYAGNHITTGSRNTLMGRRAGRGIITGVGNTIIGVNGDASENDYSYPPNLTNYTRIGQGFPREIPQDGGLDIHNLIYGTSAGRVGIGIVNPTETIDVAGGARFRNLTNAFGDAIFTRQLVQKEDGTVGYIPNNAPLPKRPAVHQADGNLINFTDKTADIIRTLLYEVGGAMTFTVTHNDEYPPFYIVTTMYSNWTPPKIKPIAGKYLLISPKGASEIYVDENSTYQLKTTASYLVSYMGGMTYIVEL